MSFHSRAVEIIKSVPFGKVATYGQIAFSAGNPRASRQISRILHSSSKKENLPWHRIVNSSFKISLKPGCGYELQKKLLEDEGIVFDCNGKINPDVFHWKGAN